jgi:hypothetical protein
VITKLPTETIRDIVMASIDEIDARCPDCDCEPDVDDENPDYTASSFSRRPPPHGNGSSESTRSKIPKSPNTIQALRTKLSFLIFFLALILSAVAADAEPPDQSLGKSYDLVDLVLDRNIVGKIISVIELVTCRNEADCYIDNTNVKQVVAVDLRHIRVEDARRLINKCHSESCSESMTGVFVGGILRLSSSEDYSPTCQKALLDTPPDSQEFSDRFKILCHKFIADRILNVLEQRFVVQKMQEEKDHQGAAAACKQLSARGGEEFGGWNDDEN